MTTIILGIFEEGLMYTTMALDVCVTYRILDFPDLSMDGTFPLGAAFTVTGIAGGFVHLVVAPPLSLLLRAVAGCVTGLIHVRLRVRDLLPGIIVMTVLYSINLRVAGESNLPIFSKDTIFSNPWLEHTIPQTPELYIVAIILLIIVLICELLLNAYLETWSGYPLRAVGGNDLLVTSPVRGRGMVRIIDLVTASGSAVLVGSVCCQQKGFSEISTGAGTIVISLTDVIIDTQLFKRFGFAKSTTVVIMGSIIHKACVSLAPLLGDLRLTFGSITVPFPIMASDLKLITSILLLIVLVTSSSRGKKVKNHAWAKAY